MRRRLIIFLLFLCSSILIYGAVIYGAETFQVLCYHDVRDDVREHYDPDSAAVSTSRLISHFAWLKSHGYHIVSIDDLVKAGKGLKELPEKAVLLTFDDGLESIYTRVFPLLKIFNYPAVVGLVGAWSEGGENRRDFLTRDFLTWEQIAELQRSGLVEFASHSYNLHEEVLANSQGLRQPAPSARVYDPGSGSYEDDTAYKKRIHTDLEKSVQLIKKHLGQGPRVMVWPYGKYNHTAVEIAVSLGMMINITQEPKINRVKDLKLLGRRLVSHNSYLDDFIRLLRNPQEDIDPVRVEPVRIVLVDLDYLYDEDKTRQAGKLDLLSERIKQMGVNVVFLRAFTGEDGDGTAGHLYFPNRHLPVKADLFNRAARQLKTQANVNVYAWLPVTAFKIPAEIKRTPVIFNPRVREIILDIYEDLSRYADFDGIFFNEETRTNDSPRFLINFTAQLKQRVEQYRAPIKTARNIEAEVILQPGSPRSFAQSYPDFLNNYDYTVVTTGVTAIPRLVEQIKATNPDLKQTIFLLPVKDRNTRNIPASDLVRQMELLQLHGALNFGYPDDFLADHPALKEIRLGISLQTYPYEKK